MGGAKNCPETPRQKMIGMMYLVLTAMLALNVSTDILNGFKLVDESLHSSLEATTRRNEDMLDQFGLIKQQNPEKNGPYYIKAEEIHKRADSLYNYIDNFKTDIALLADGKDAKTTGRVADIVGTSNLDVTGQYGVVEGHGAELKELIRQYKEYMIEASEGSKAVEFEKLFATNRGVNHDGDSIEWEMTVFEGMPVGASITILTKLQNDVRTAEGEMISYMMSSADASDFRVNKMKALVIPSSRNVISGSKYTAQIMLAGVDSTQAPDYYVEGVKLDSTGIYEVLATGSGLKKYSGELVMQNRDGSELRLPFESDYSVMPPSASIENEDLNVMYRDYANKFNISVPGVAPDKVRVSVTGATAQQQGGKWIIRTAAGTKKVTVSVSAEIDGKMQSMGSREYRVKTLPKPGAFVYLSDNQKFSEGKVPRSVLLNSNTKIVADYGDEGLLPLNFTITSFQLQTSLGFTQGRGNKFTSQQIEQLSKLKQGAQVTILAIKAKNAEGKEVSLRGIPLTLN